MLLAIPDFSPSGKEQRVTLIRVEDIRKIVVVIPESHKDSTRPEDDTVFLLVKDEPIGRIHVRRKATIKALYGLHEIIKKSNKTDAIVMLDEDGNVKVFGDVLEKILKGSENGDNS